jgi:Concanavalin A-like lectin/glucanases superfamily
MSRGFGPNFGASSTTDTIITGLSFSWPTLFSFSCWFYMNSLGTSPRIFANNSNPGVGAFQLLGNTGVLDFGTSVASGTNGTWSIPLPSFGVWHHIALTYDSTSLSNTPVMYVDGVAQTVTLLTAPTSGVVSGAVKYNIGNASSLSRSIDGMMAELAFWSGIILSAAEISALAVGVPLPVFRPEKLSLYIPMTGRDNLEFDSFKPVLSSITGTRLGTSNPPTASFAQSREARLNADIFPSQIGIICSIAVTEAGDTLSAAALETLSAIAALVESGDTLAASALAIIATSAGVAESPDTISAAVLEQFIASAALTEDPNTISAVAAEIYTVFAELIESGDLIVANAAAIGVAAALMESGDAISAAALMIANTNIGKAYLADKAAASISLSDVKGFISVSDARAAELSLTD